MAIVTDITKLSQTASLNGPDGSVDPPSSLDDQDRYLGSFIAMLRDGVGFTAGAAITAIGFTPVQQGGGTSQTADKVYIGWDAIALNGFRIQVNVTDFGRKWPIDISGNCFGSSASCTGNAASATTSAACSGNAATATTANSATYLQGGYVPTSFVIRGTTNNFVMSWTGSRIIFAVDGNSFGSVMPMDISGSAASANYANSAGSAPANGGTSAACSGNAATATNANNANTLQGLAPGNFVQNGNNVTSLQANGTLQMQATVGGQTCYWGMNLSDARLKKDIAPTQVDSLAQITRMRFVGFNWRDDLDFEIGDDTFNPVAILAQEAELIEPKWISNAGTWKQPDQYTMLMSAMHSIQQLSAKVAKLSQLITGGS